jgi:predicted DNA-binding protein (MmcQ/YjbR family)
MSGRCFFVICLFLRLFFYTFVVMNIEELRDYCLSLGADVEERMPFGAFRAAQGVLAFYVLGHIFCFFDIDDYSVVTVKCQPERIPELAEHNAGIVAPYNMNPKYWIGIRPDVAEYGLMRRLLANSYQLVRSKYSKPPKAGVASASKKSPKK